ncbi:hypothetical protein IMZ48_48985 [Candidatus Bathyarchaeota archaeon]|nr:hypothetical protein [Candidatus Bathyarchaeota archaeon]
MLLKNLLLCELAALAAASPLLPGLGGGLGKLVAKLGSASWDVEGFARDNPLGATTGGAGGKKTTVSTAEEFTAAVTAEGPAIVYVKGDISLTERVNISSDTSVIGVGRSAHFHENGLNVMDASNVIVQNIKVSSIKDTDSLTLWNATRVWVDHNEFSSDISKGPDFYVRTPSPNPLTPISY